MERKRVVELDLLRFTAAIAVVAHHLLPFAATRLGYLGVELFFLISGYVILATATHKDGYSFVVGRIARLFPSFLVAVTITAAMLMWSGKDVSLQTYLGNMTMLPTFVGADLLDVVYWTLCIEIKFYALIFCLVVTKQIHDIERWILAWLSVCAMSIAFPKVGALGHLALNGYSALFGAGCLMYLIRRDGLVPSRVLALMISLALAINQGVIDGIAGKVTETGQYYYLWMAGIIVAEYAIFLALSLRLWKLPKWSIWSTLGALTYPLYLLHNEAALAFTRVLGGNVLVTLLFGLCAALLLTYTTERYACSFVQRKLLALWVRDSRAVAPSKNIPLASNK